MSRDDLDAEPRYLEQFRKVAHKCVIGLPIHCGSTQCKLHCIAVQADNALAFRARLHADGEGDATLSRPHTQSHYSASFGDSSCKVLRVPKIAEPTRTQVDPSSMATAKS